MELQNYYWCFQGALPHRICDDIVAYGNALKQETAVTFGYDPNNMTPNQQKQLEQKRKSNVVWMDPVWIYRELHPLVMKLMLVLVGIIIGIGPNLVNLLNMTALKNNIMIGTLMRG